MAKTLANVLPILVLTALSAPPRAIAADAPAPPAPSAASATVGSLAVQLDAQGNTLVVTDVVRHALAVYKIDGSEVRLVGIRRLDKDFASETGASTAPPPTPAEIPSSDLPGTDPPSFERPARSVRVASSYNGGPFASSESWSADYDVHGTLPDVFVALRKHFHDWTITEQSIAKKTRSGFSAVKDRAKIDVYVTPIWATPNWVKVSVSESVSKR